LKNFVVIFELKPAVRIKKNGFNVILKEFDGDKRVIITRTEQKVGNQMIQTGLLFRVYISADNVNQARERAKGFVDGVVGLLTFSTNVGLSIPNEMLAYELTPDTQEREFLQILYNPANVTPSRRTVNHNFFENLLNHVFKQGDESHHNVARALRWYRMGTLTFDPFDKFNCFWVGLEALNPILQKKIGVAKEIRKIKCDNCGYEVPIEKRTISGIKRFVTEKMENPTLFKRCAALRVHLMHSTCELNKIENEAIELTPQLIEVLFRAVCFVLDFEDWNILPFRETLENVPVRMEFEGNLIGDYTGTLGFDGKDPYLEPNQASIQPKVEENGEITFENTLEITTRIEPFKSFQLHELRIYGDKEMKATISKIEVKSKNQPNRP
jgi:hypothetical protein